MAAVRQFTGTTGDDAILARVAMQADASLEMAIQDNE
jgi:hypothetical protein